MSKRRPSVYAMVHEVMAEAKEKLAESPGLAKTAAVANTVTPIPTADEYTDFLKIAKACDHLSEHIHLVNDDRTPQEKLAEYAAIHEAVKQAAEAGDANPDQAHQTAEANPESISPKTVGTDDSGTGVGAGNAIPSEETNTPGTGPEAGGQGTATGPHQSPKSVQPTEAPNTQDAANALESNQEMMMADQPENVLKQSAAQSPVFQRLVAGKSKMAQVIERANFMKKASVLLQKAASTGVPEGVAMALIRHKYADDFAKLGEDALNPASISAGTEPALQSSAGVPSPLSQGAEVGENTPRETAPTSGEGGGRELVSSNEAAINAKKGQAKQQNKGALGECLTEPALSAAHDTTLQQSLDNTSSAGVKISSAQVEAARELLRKFQVSSPENAQKLAALHKLSMDPDMAAGGGAPPSPGEMTAVPDDEVPPEAALEAEGLGAEGLGAEGEAEAAPVSEEALEAVKAGVTSEEVAQAEQLLALQGEEAAAAEGAEGLEGLEGLEGAAAPEGAPDKQSQMGTPGGGGGLGMTGAM